MLVDLSSAKNGSGRDFLHPIINRIALNSFEAGVFDHGDEFLFGHFYPAVFDGVAFG